MNEADPSAVRSVALDALELGLSILPPRDDGSKAPLADWTDPQTGKPIWKPAQEHLPERGRLKQWYANGRTGVGLVCGRVSGGLELFEFDDADTYAAFQEAAAAVGLAELMECIEAGYLESTPAG